MERILEKKQQLLMQLEKLHQKHVLSEDVTEDYYDPGMMENLAQFDGTYDPDTGIVLISTEAKGLRYEGRTLHLETLAVGDSVKLIREPNNPFNSNNFMIHTLDDRSLGNLSADLCNAIAPLFDAGYAVIESCTVSYLETIFQRSRYAKQGVLFIKLKLRLRGI